MSIYKYVIFTDVKFDIFALRQSKMSRRRRGTKTPEGLPGPRRQVSSGFSSRGAANVRPGIGTEIVLP